MTTYEQSERLLFQRNIADIENQSLEDRRQAKKGFQHLLETDKGYKHLTNAAKDIIRGDYCDGAKFYFQALSKRTNRRAWLFNTIAALCDNCSQAFATKVWHEQSKENQNAINAALNAVLAEADAEKELE